MIAHSNETQRKPYMTAEELAVYLGVCKKTVANWKQAGLLVFFQIRRVVRYDVTACVESLRNHQAL